MKTEFFDTPVALVFFARPDVLQHSFEAIRQAKPKTLYLIQDGPRENRDSDKVLIDKCREIVNNVDWNCTVYRNYSDSNLGCGIRVYSGLNWAFEKEDRMIILEDDCVPSVDFFRFCEEILERYKDDQRIDMISGMNHLEVYKKTPYDYFFTTTGSIAGWATWKRVWEKIEFNMPYKNDEDAKRLITNLYGKSLFKRIAVMDAKIQAGDRVTSWSLQRGMNMLLNSGLIIVPRVNLMQNIGITENSTNSPSSIKYVPKSLRKLYNLKTSTLDFPLKHPKYIINDIEYKKMVDRFMGRTFFIKKFRILESTFYRIIFGDFKGLFQTIRQRFKK